MTRRTWSEDTITVEISYKVPTPIGMDLEFDKVLDSIAKRHLGEWTNSGSGLGYRDISFEFRNQSVANQFILEVKRVAQQQGKKLAWAR